MRMSDIARMYIGLNVYNEDTAKAITVAARLFDMRSGIDDIQDIDYEALATFKHEVLNVARAKPITYNSYLRYLRLLGAWALEEGFWEKDWFARVKRAPEPSAPPKTIDTDVFAAAFTFLKTHPDVLPPAWFWLLVIRFFYYTGIRRRQIVSIELQDIDLENRILIASYRGSKTRKEWSIPLAEELVEDVKYLIRRNENALGRLMRPTDKLFNVCRFNSRYKPDPKNPGAMTGACITGFMKRLSAHISMRIGAHRIRHTTATTLCNFEDEENPDIFAVQELLGHTVLKTTRGYVKTKISRVRMQVNKLSLPRSGYYREK